MVHQDSRALQLQGIAQDINKKYELLLKTREAREKYESKKENFFEIFSERKQLYLVMGIVCIMVLIFDYFVSHETLQYLAQIIRLQSSVLALIFSILDGALAILASGGLAGNNTRLKELQRKIFSIILILLATTKLVLFGFFVYDSYLAIDSFGNKVLTLTSWEFIRVLLPQLIFIIIVYSVLTFAGIGLFYIVGIAWYAIYGTLLRNPLAIEEKIRTLFNKHFRYTASERFEEELQFHNLQKIYNDVNQGKSSQGVKEYGQN